MSEPSRTAESGGAGFIPFNRPYLTGKEVDYIREAHRSGQLAGDGTFTRRCQEWLEGRVGCRKTLLTHSCTAALEMAAILVDLRAGDEIIMPSYTFVSTANAFVLRGGTPVFVDVRPDTLNIDESRIEAAVTSRTRAIVVVHYAGVACEMEAIEAITASKGLLLIEDSAQALLSTYRNRPLGSFGQLAALSFHETKNIMCGEGGALLINDDRFIERAVIIRDKGTNRNLFSRGRVDRYAWVDIGSSFLPGELIAAFLCAQLEEAEAITAHRRRIWDQYDQTLEELEGRGRLRRPRVPAHCRHNAHMYYVLLEDPRDRPRLLRWLRDRGILGVFHYVPLHSSPAGMRYGRAHGGMGVTDSVSARVVRLPLWVGLSEVDRVVDSIHEYFESPRK